MAAKINVPSINLQSANVFLPQVIIAIVIVSFAVYFNALFNSFVFDDIQNVIENRWIKDLRYIPEVFSSHLAGFNPRYATPYYRPLAHLIYMFSYAVFGLNPWGFHLVNILFHSGVCVLIFLIVSRLTADLHFSNPSPYLSPAFISALLFAANPIHTEAVTWVAGVMDVSFAFFYLLSLYFYIRAGEDQKALYFLSVISFFLATICKEPALTLPALLVAYDFLFKEKRREEKRREEKRREEKRREEKRREEKNFPLFIALCPKIFSLPDCYWNIFFFKVQCAWWFCPEQTILRA